MARMRFFSLPLALKYLKIDTLRVPFAFNKILIFFSIEAHQKRKWHNFWFRAVYKATILHKNVQYIWNNENSISYQNPNSNKITYETRMNSIQNKANNETI